MAPAVKGGHRAVARRLQQRGEFWPEDRAWLGPEEVGYFCAPRTRPFILRALREKSAGGSKDPGSVYLELLSRHMGQGVVELTHHEDHAYAADYAQVKTWQERMRVLEDAGFIKTTTSGGRKFARVLLVHPAIAMQKLHDQGRIPKDLWEAYRSRQIEASEPSAEELGAPASS